MTELDLARIDMNANLNVAIGKLKDLIEETPTQELFSIRILLETSMEKAENLVKISSTEVQAAFDDVEHLDTELTREKDSAAAVQESFDAANNKLKRANAETIRLGKAESDLQTELSEERKKTETLQEKLDKINLLESNKGTELEKLRLLPPQIKSLTETLNKSAKKIARLSDDLTERKRLNKEQKDSLTSAKAEVKNLKKSLQDASDPRELRLENNGTKFYLGTVDVPIGLKTDKSELIESIETPWHIRILTSKAIAVYPSTSEYLTPIIPACNVIENDWKDEFDQVVHSMMMDKAKDSYPKHHARALAAKSIVITKSMVSEKELEWLHKSKMKTVFDVLSITFTRLAARLDVNNSEEDLLICQVHELYEKIKLMEPPL